MVNKEDSLIIDGAQLEQIGDFVEKIERAKQEAAIKQIESVDKDNERQYQFALKRLEVDSKKWNQSFWVGSIIAGTLATCGIVFLFMGKYDIGIGLLTSTLAGVFGFVAGAGSCEKSDY